MKREDIFDKMIEEKKSILHIDPWANMRKEFDAMKESSGIIEYKGLKFSISKKSGGGVRMGEFPPTIDITIIHTF